MPQNARIRTVAIAQSLEKDVANRGGCVPMKG